MKFMSFNTQHCLNYIERKIDFEIMAKAISDCDADVVGLNEMRDLGTSEEYVAQVKELSTLTGMKYYYFAKAFQFPEGPYGNAILSKVPIINAESIIIPDPDPRAYDGYYETRCVLKAELEGGITVLITHMGLNKDEQENAVETVMAHITDKKCVLMGDFNMTPNDATLSPIFSAMRDTAECFDSEKLSFPSDNPTMKIDYILVSRDVKVISADVPSIVASDHRPHVAEIHI